jgi:ABC-type transporter Mla MlaB component
MMRVQVRESREDCTLLIEGAIEGAAAIELEWCWRNLKCGGIKTLVIDFSGVLRVDQQARALLRVMHRNGVRFTGARLAVADILDEIISWR